MRDVLFSGLLQQKAFILGRKQKAEGSYPTSPVPYRILQFQVRMGFMPCNWTSTFVPERENQDPESQACLSLPHFHSESCVFSFLTSSFLQTSRTERTAANTASLMTLVIALIELSLIKAQPCGREFPKSCLRLLINNSFLAFPFKSL